MKGSNEMMMKKRNKQAGFTLIELMIALFILSLVIAGYVAANIKAQQNSEAMNERTIAIQDANRLIELMREEALTGIFPANVVTQFPDPDLGNQVPQFTDAESSVLDNKSVGISYCRNEISPCPPGDTTANPLDVTVTVRWRSYDQRQHTEKVRTYITQR